MRLNPWMMGCSKSVGHGIATKKNATGNAACLNQPLPPAR